MPTDDPQYHLSIPPTPASGNLAERASDDPLLWHQVAALRELLQEGAELLGQVLKFTRTAEELLATREEEKAAQEQKLRELLEERDRAHAELAKARETLERQHQASAEKGRLLEAEIQSLRAQTVRVENVEELGGEEVERRRALETELERTRLMLAGERLRRNRAISLIRPNGEDCVA